MTTAALIRDIVIIIWGILGIIILALVGVFGFMLYRRIKRVVDTVSATTKAIRDVAQQTQHMVKPVNQAVSVARAVLAGVTSAGEVILGRQRKEDSDGKQR